MVKPKEEENKFDLVYENPANYRFDGYLKNVHLPKKIW